MPGGNWITAFLRSARSGFFASVGCVTVFSAVMPLGASVAVVSGFSSKLCAALKGVSSLQVFVGSFGAHQRLVFVFRGRSDERGGRDLRRRRRPRRVTAGRVADELAFCAECRCQTRIFGAVNPVSFLVAVEDQAGLDEAVRVVVDFEVVVVVGGPFDVAFDDRVGVDLVRPRTFAERVDRPCSAARVDVGAVGGRESGQRFEVVDPASSGRLRELAELRVRSTVRRGRRR